MRTADWTESVSVLDRVTAVVEAFGDSLQDSELYSAIGATLRRVLPPSRNGSRMEKVRYRPAKITAGHFHQPRSMMRGR